MLSSTPKGLILVVIFAFIFATAFGDGLPGKPGDSEDFKPEDVMDIEKVASNPRMKKAHKACKSVPNFDKLKLSKEHWLSTMQYLSESGHKPCSKALIKEFGMNGKDRHYHHHHHHQSKRGYYRYNGGQGGRGGGPGQPGQPGGR